MQKRGNLKVEQFVMSDLYNLAEYYGYDDNKSVERSETKNFKNLRRSFFQTISKMLKYL